MSEIKHNRVEVEKYEHGSQKGKFRAHARSEMGQGWQIPLRDMSPNDLRWLADYMEEQGVGSDQFGGDSLCL